MVGLGLRSCRRQLSALHQISVLARNGSRERRRRSICSWRTVELERGTVLCNTGDRLRHAYFPIGCVLSTLATLSDGSSLEVNVIGAEGAHRPHRRQSAAARPPPGLSCWSAGQAARVPMRARAGRVRAQRARSRPSSRHMRESACSRFSNQQCARRAIRSRPGFARWLLAIHDRAPGDYDALDARVRGRPSGRKQNERDVGCRRSAAGGPHHVSARHAGDHRPGRSGGGIVRMLRRDPGPYPPPDAIAMN